MFSVAFKITRELFANGGGCLNHIFHRYLCWTLFYRRLQKNFKGDVVTQLQNKYPALCDERNMLAFKRKWEYMFEYAEVGFARAYSSLTCWTFARPVRRFTQFFYVGLAESFCPGKRVDGMCLNRDRQSSDNIRAFVQMILALCILVIWHGNILPGPWCSRNPGNNEMVVKVNAYSYDGDAVMVLRAPLYLL